MIKKIFPIALLILTLLLAACGSNAAATSAADAALPKQTQLILGTLKLEETDYAVNAAQAQELLPMWYALKSLNESDTAAQEEKDGLTNQIEEMMTQDQIKALEGMKFTREDMFTLIRGNRSGSGNSAQGSGSSTRSNNNGGGFDGPPPDMMGGGGFPGGGFGGNGNNASSNSSNGNQSSNYQAADTPSALFELVIKLLQGKTAR